MKITPKVSYLKKLHNCKVAHFDFLFESCQYPLSMAHKNKTNHSPYKSRKGHGPKTATTSEKTSLRGYHRKATVIYELNEANDRLADIFKNHHFDLVSHEERILLAKFYRLLMQNQEKENFTRLLSLKDIAIKHFIDSLIILKHTELQFPLLDIGTGPGFPGVPLKIKFPKEKIILAEGVQKRVTFLKKIREELHLENLEIIGRNINPEFVYPVMGVITRALEDISNTLSNAVNCLQIGGRVYLMKGPNVDPEIKMAQKQWNSHYRLIKDIHYDLPETSHQRRLVIYEKIKG